MMPVHELTSENVGDYLSAGGLIPSGSTPIVEELGGGISNVVLRVETPNECFVLKQSLPKLRVADDWPFDRRRIFRESDCMSYLGEMLPAGTVPRVVFRDDPTYAFAMTCAPPGGASWKQLLMAGEVNLSVAARAGELLAAIHNLAVHDARVSERFEDSTVFVEGRLDPYHWTTARRNPDVAEIIMAETDRMLGTRLVLVHGDFSPKNLVVYMSDQECAGLLLLDFEVAHFGDPAFDVGFCLTHFLLKAIRFPQRRTRYVNAAGIFWRRYFDSLQPSLDQGIALTAARELGCILLARIDGKSKIEYIIEEPMKDTARRLSRGILLDPSLTVEAALDLTDRPLAVSSRA
jgi:5-methylthioribose kinase